MKEIWVAEGAYLPVPYEYSADIEKRKKSFKLVSGVKMYGGFPKDATTVDNAPSDYSDPLSVNSCVICTMRSTGKAG